MLQSMQSSSPDADSDVESDLDETTDVGQCRGKQELSDGEESREEFYDRIGEKLEESLKPE